MGLIRPATPGFLVTLVATILLAVVVFCVPYFKSIYFLKASISVQGLSGNITFGTLGYCLELTNGTTCSKPSIGYELDINGLVGNKLPVEIPQVAVKWITYALVLHIVALAGAAGSAVFGLLAHVREMSMACCSTFISGFAAVVAMLAFIFDLVLFFVAKSRINAVGSAQIGNAIWLTLAAWLLLFFSGCFYALGRCCISNRPRAPGGKGNRDNGGGGGMWGNRDNVESGPNKDYAEQVRLDAVKAEADRKARAAQKPVESGLPAFYEAQPLTGHVDGDQVYVDGDDHSQTHLVPTGRQGTGYAGGYVQGAPGTRTIDDYYGGPQTPAANTYPPQNPRRDNSTYAASTYSANVRHSPVSQPALPSQGAYAASPYGYNVPQTQSPPPNLLAPPGQYPSDPYAQEYGHAAGGSSYYTASPHEQEPSGYAQYDPYGAQPQQHNRYAEPSYNDPYTNNPPMPTTSGFNAPPNPYMNHTPTPPPPQQGYPERQYTLGGDGYGASSVPPLQEHYNNPPGGYGYSESPLTQAPPAPINTNAGYIAQAAPTSPLRGPRAQPGSMSQEDAPPGYDAGAAGVTGNWGKR